MVSASPAIRCRQIDEGDVAAVAELLRRGFPNRNRRFWQRALNALARREPPPGLPKYGYLLESGGTPVGAILMICSAMRSGDTLAPRCNLSSWYVESAFRT
ncbi:MAG: acyl-CoA acyltransferase, partial [Xanthobacteraceae bacterium]